MRRLTFLICAVSAACSQGASAPPAEARGEAAGSALTVVELFQSQGCSSCPPANANLNALASRADVLALSYAVTYWDYLGWKDTFAKPAFTERQRAYHRRGQSDGVYTPQVVINGAKALVGANSVKLGRAIRGAGPLTDGPTLARDGSDIAIGAGTGGPASVLVVTYDPRERKVPVKAGENTGRTLPHRNVVLDLREAGVWSGKPLRVALPPPLDPALRRAVLLQKGAGGPILAAAKI